MNAATTAAGEVPTWTSTSSTDAVLGWTDIEAGAAGPAGLTDLHDQLYEPA